MGFPITVYSDDDGAFKAEVKAFFESEMINQVITRSHAHVAERFIKTLKSAIHDRVRNTDRKWEDMVPFVVKKYNKTVHSSTGNSPNDGHKFYSLCSTKCGLSNYENKRYYVSNKVSYPYGYAG